MYLIYGIVHCIRQTVGSSGGRLYCLCGSAGVGKPPTANFADESSQFFQFSVSQFIHGFKAFHERNGGGTGILNALILSHARAFKKQVIGKPLLLAGQVLDHIKSGSGKGLQGLVAVIVHVDLPGNSAEAEMVGNHESVHPVVLRQVGIGILELTHLLGIENMDLPLVVAKAAIFPERIHKAVPVDGSGLQPYHHITELHGAERRHDSL